MVLLQNNHGFTLIELMLILSVVVIVSLLYLPSQNTYQPEHFNPTYSQLKAMATKQRVYLLSNLWFNENGNINQAQTVEFRNSICVFQLGMGRYRCLKKGSSS